MNIRTSRTTPNYIIIAVGCVWGLYWIPLREVNALTTAPAWTNVTILLCACAVLSPAAWRGRRKLLAASDISLLSLCLGGASFALYSDALLIGHVTTVILLFYLTPVWSTLIERFWSRQRVSWWRYLGIVSGLAGIAIVLRGNGGGMPVPHSLGAWFGLVSGILWSLASGGIHMHGGSDAAESNFIFCAGAAIMALTLSLGIGGAVPVHVPIGRLFDAVGMAFLIGVCWWALSLTAFLWAAQQLEPARVGILLMSEVIVGAASSTALAGGPIKAFLVLGTALVVFATVVETVSANV